MLEKLVDTLMQDGGDEIPAYTLIMGAGASYGAVPTAKQMLGVPDEGKIHDLSIPLWLAKRKGIPFPDETAKSSVVKEFWRNFEEKNRIRLKDKEGGFQLDANGTPINVAAAYQSVFDTACIGGLDTPERHQIYMREVTLSAKPTRLNATHFYLASLLSLQRYAKDAPGNKGAGDRPLYLGRREFARTLFTTNFDPLLQTSLQLFQLLYYMTDRPELLTADALQTDRHQAIHLFYAHGSVHRPFMAHTEEQISLLKQQNARDLVAYLGSHGVIVLGYSGWDDCLLDALKQTKTFANNLYWLARGEDSVSDKVREFITSHPNAYWVEIDDGGRFMAQLHGRLCPGAPNTSMLYNPIRPLIQQLECVDLTGIPNYEDEAQARTKENDSLAIESNADKGVEAIRRKVIHLLNAAEKTFTRDGQHLSFELRLDLADLSMASKDYEAALKIYNEVLDQADRLATPVKGRALAGRGECHKNLGLHDNALSDFTEAILMNDPSSKWLAKSLFYRGVMLVEAGDTNAAIGDFGAMSALEGITPEQTAGALFNRGWCFSALGKTEDAIRDYTRVIELDGALAEQRAKASFNRGICFSRLRKIDEAIRDYTRVIELDGAPLEQRAQALVNRGTCYGKQEKFEEEISDYTRVIELEGVLPDQKAMALLNRSICYGKQEKVEEEISDYTRVIELEGVSPEQRARALFNRGVYYGKKGKIEEEISDYTRVIELENVSPDQKARALVNRGASYGNKGKIEDEISDYTRVIELEGILADQKATALLNRGICYGKQEKIEPEISDYTRVIELDGARPDQKAKALLALGFVFERNEMKAEAMSDYREVLSLADAPADIVKLAKERLDALLAEESENAVPPVADESKKSRAKKAVQKKPQKAVPVKSARKRSKKT